MSLSRISSIGSSGSIDSGTVASGSTQERDGIVNQQPDNCKSTVPGEGFCPTIISLCCGRCVESCDACHGSCLSKIKAFFMCVTTPLYVLLKPLFDARGTRRKVTHQGIIYFYVVMAFTIVLNLWVQQNKDRRKDRHLTHYKLLEYFEASVMVGTLIAMICIAWVSHGHLKPAKHEKNVILYFRIGLFVFGIASMVDAVVNTINDINCKNGMKALVSISKFSFISGQMLFLTYFYQVKLLCGGWMVQFSLAHMLGANLSLWIWTLCKEVYDPGAKDKCDSKNPISLGHTEKYFYPLFIEYLLLAASMVYELWMDLQLPKNASWRSTRHNWIHEKYQEELERATDSRSLPARRQRKFTPSLALSFVFGVAISCIFIGFVVASNESNPVADNKWYTYYIIVNICLYSTQIFACYVVKVCSQSQPANRDRSSLNLDDSLLYFGLAGIFIWEGFHFYELYSQRSKAIFFVHGALGMFEDIIQTVILVSVRRLSNRKDKNALTIRNMSLFLLATNLALWVQNSFYIEQELQNPGEDFKPKIISEELKTYAYILNPIIIFFRFHSATCSFQMWDTFNDQAIIDN